MKTETVFGDLTETITPVLPAEVVGRVGVSGCRTPNQSISALTVSREYYSQQVSEVLFEHYYALMYRSCRNPQHNSFLCNFEPDHIVNFTITGSTMLDGVPSWYEHIDYAEPRHALAKCGLCNTHTKREGDRDLQIYMCRHCFDAWLGSYTGFKVTSNSFGWHYHQGQINFIQLDSYYFSSHFNTYIIRGLEDDIDFPKGLYDVVQQKMQSDNVVSHIYHMTLATCSMKWTKAKSSMFHYFMTNISVGFLKYETKTRSTAPNCYGTDLVDDGSPFMQWIGGGGAVFVAFDDPSRIFIISNRQANNNSCYLKPNDYTDNLVIRVSYCHQTKVYTMISEQIITERKNIVRYSNHFGAHDHPFLLYWSYVVQSNRITPTPYAFVRAIQKMGMQSYQEALTGYTAVPHPTGTAYFGRVCTNNKTTNIVHPKFLAEMHESDDFTVACRRHTTSKIIAEYYTLPRYEVGKFLFKIHPNGAIIASNQTYFVHVFNKHKQILPARKGQQRAISLVQCNRGSSFHDIALQGIPVYWYLGWSHGEPDFHFISFETYPGRMPYELTQKDHWIFGYYCPKHIETAFHIFRSYVEIMGNVRHLSKKKQELIAGYLHYMMKGHLPYVHANAILNATIFRWNLKDTWSAWKTFSMMNDSLIFACDQSSFMFFDAMKQENHIWKQVSDRSLPTYMNRLFDKEPPFIEFKKKWKANLDMGDACMFKSIGGFNPDTITTSKTTTSYHVEDITESANTYMRFTGTDVVYDVSDTQSVKIEDDSVTTAFWKIIQTGWGAVRNTMKKIADALGSAFSWNMGDTFWNMLPDSLKRIIKNIRDAVESLNLVPIILKLVLIILVITILWKIAATLQEIKWEFSLMNWLFGLKGEHEIKTSQLGDEGQATVGPLINMAWIASAVTGLTVEASKGWFKDVSAYRGIKMLIEDVRDNASKLFYMAYYAATGEEWCQTAAWRREIRAKTDIISELQKGSADVDFAKRIACDKQWCIDMSKALYKWFDCHQTMPRPKLSDADIRSYDSQKKQYIELLKRISSDSPMAHNRTPSINICLRSMESRSGKDVGALAFAFGLLEKRHQKYPDKYPEDIHDNTIYQVALGSDFFAGYHPGLTQAVLVSEALNSNDSKEREKQARVLLDLMDVRSMSLNMPDVESKGVTFAMHAVTMMTTPLADISNNGLAQRGCLEKRLHVILEPMMAEDRPVNWDFRPEHVVYKVFAGTKFGEGEESDPWEFKCQGFKYFEDLHGKTASFVEILKRLFMIMCENEEMESIHDRVKRTLVQGDACVFTEFLSSVSSKFSSWADSMCEEVSDIVETCEQSIAETTEWVVFSKQSLFPMVRRRFKNVSPVHVSVYSNTPLVDSELHPQLTATYPSSVLFATVMKKMFGKCLEPRRDLTLAINSFVQIKHHFAILETKDKLQYFSLHKDIAKSWTAIVKQKISDYTFEKLKERDGRFGIIARMVETLTWSPLQEYRWGDYFLMFCEMVYEDGDLFNFVGFTDNGLEFVSTEVLDDIFDDEEQELQKEFEDELNANEVVGDNIIMNPWVKKSHISVLMPYQGMGGDKRTMVEFLRLYKKHYPEYETYQCFSGSLLGYFVEKTKQYCVKNNHIAAHIIEMKEDYRMGLFFRVGKGVKEILTNYWAVLAGTFAVLTAIGVGFSFIGSSGKQRETKTTSQMTHMLLKDDDYETVMSMPSSERLAYLKQLGYKIDPTAQYIFRRHRDPKQNSEGIVIPPKTADQKTEKHKKKQNLSIDPSKITMRSQQLSIDPNTLNRKMQNLSIEPQKITFKRTNMVTRAYHIDDSWKITPEFCPIGCDEYDYAWPVNNEDIDELRNNKTAEEIIDMAEFYSQHRVMITGPSGIAFTELVKECYEKLTIGAACNEQEIEEFRHRSLALADNLVRIGLYNAKGHEVKGCALFIGGRTMCFPKHYLAAVMEFSVLNVYLHDTGEPFSFAPFQMDFKVPPDGRDLVIVTILSKSFSERKNILKRLPLYINSVHRTDKCARIFRDVHPDRVVVSIVINETPTILEMNQPYVSLLRNAAGEDTKTYYPYYYKLHNAPTVHGDCGSPVVNMDSNSHLRDCFGIIIGNSKGCCIIVPICQGDFPMCDNTPELITPSTFGNATVSPIISKGIEENQQFIYMLQPGCRALTTLSPISLLPSQNSQFEKSNIYDELEQFSQRAREPFNMPEIPVSPTNLTNEAQRNAKQRLSEVSGCKPTTPFIERMLKNPKSYEGFGSKNAGTSYKIRNLYQTLFAHRGMKSFPTDKSATFDLKIRRKDRSNMWGHENSPHESWVCKEGDGKQWINPMLRYEIAQLVEKIESGNYKFQGQAEFCLKDELVLNEKSRNKKTRLFSVSSLYLAILCKMLLGDYMGNHHDVIDNPVKIGVASNTRDWGYIYDLLISLENLVGGDYKGWDYSILCLFIDSFSSWMIGLPWDEDPKRVKLWVDALASSVVGFIMIHGRFVFERCQGVSSGHYWTSLFNSFVNYVVFRITFYALVPEEFHEDIDKLYRMIFYGDDNGGCVDGKIKEYFNLITISKFLKDSFGLTLTTPTKGEIKELFLQIEDFTFLSRGFVNEDGRIKAPLDPVAIVGMLAWIKKSTVNTPLQQLDSNIETALRELLMHKEENYAEFLEFFMSLRSKYGLKFQIPDEDLARHFAVKDYYY